ERETALRETWARSFGLVVAEQSSAHAPPHFTGLDRESLIADSLKLALPAHGAGDPGFDRVVSLADAADLPWVMEPRGAASRHWAEQACRSAGFEPDVRYETADLQAHVRLIETANAVALLPGLVHARAPRGMRVIDLEGNPRRTVFTAARHSSAEHAGVNAVRRALRAEAQALASEDSAFAS
ncbi:MAG: LysR family transcriptional regulator, partial [Microbacteriaceae bacterium]|nr:LysR family transcriptional regulator [Microbacteriaceae bacterium]